MHTFSFSEYVRYIEAGDWESIASLLLSSVAKVAKAGAHFAIGTGGHYWRNLAYFLDEQGILFRLFHDMLKS